MAANATFALKPGVWFLRVRFVIFAPDSRREPSPPSGRKSTQPTVQILEASSTTTGEPPSISLSFDVTNGPPVIVFAEIQVEGLDGVANLGDPPTLSLDLPRGASVPT